MSPGRSVQHSTSHLHLTRVKYSLLQCTVLHTFFQETRLVFASWTVASLFGLGFMLLTLYFLWCIQCDSALSYIFTILGHALCAHVSYCCQILSKASRSPGYSCLTSFYKSSTQHFSSLGLFWLPCLMKTPQG